jgi:hypothetical protein
MFQLERVLPVIHVIRFCYGSAVLPDHFELVDEKFFRFSEYGTRKVHPFGFFIHRHAENDLVPVNFLHVSGMRRRSEIEPMYNRVRVFQQYIPVNLGNDVLQGFLERKTDIHGFLIAAISQDYNDLGIDAALVHFEQAAIVNAPFPQVHVGSPINTTHVVIDAHADLWISIASNRQANLDNFMILMGNILYQVATA